MTNQKWKLLEFGIFFEKEITRLSKNFSNPDKFLTFSMLENELIESGFGDFFEKNNKNQIKNNSISEILLQVFSEELINSKNDLKIKMIKFSNLIGQGYNKYLSRNLKLIIEQIFLESSGVLEFGKLIDGINGLEKENNLKIKNKNMKNLVISKNEILKRLENKNLILRPLRKDRIIQKNGIKDFIDNLMEHTQEETKIDKKNILELISFSILEEINLEEELNNSENTLYINFDINKVSKNNLNLFQLNGINESLKNFNENIYCNEDSESSLNFKIIEGDKTEILKEIIKDQNLLTMIDFKPEFKIGEYVKLDNSIITKIVGLKYISDGIYNYNLENNIEISGYYLSKGTTKLEKLTKEEINIFLK